MAKAIAQRAKKAAQVHCQSENRVAASAIERCNTRRLSDAISVMPTSRLCRIEVHGGCELTVLQGDPRWRVGIVARRCRGPEWCRSAGSAPGAESTGMTLARPAWTWIRPCTRPTGYPHAPSRPTSSLGVGSCFSRIKRRTHPPERRNYADHFARSTLPSRRSSGRSA